VFCRCFPGILTQYSRSIHEKTLPALKDAAKSVSRLHSEFYPGGGIVRPRNSKGATMLDRATATQIPLDVTTLFIVATCVAALLGLVLLFAWSHDRIRALA
jgi:hypothetical protein